MKHFPESREGGSFDIDALLAKVRAGLDAERELANLCGGDPGILVWLREEGMLPTDPDHPNSGIVLSQMHEVWQAEIIKRRSRVSSAGSFWRSVRERVVKASKEFYGAEAARKRKERKAAIGAPSPEEARKRPPASFDSRRFLLLEWMSRYESCYVRPAMQVRHKKFEPLCRALFRLCVWRFLVRRARNPKAPQGRLALSYPMLAALAHGFGPDKEQLKRQGRTINNWLTPSLANFMEALDREDIHRLWNEVDEDEGEAEEQESAGGDGDD